METWVVLQDNAHCLHSSELSSKMSQVYAKTFFFFQVNIEPSQLWQHHSLDSNWQVSSTYLETKSFKKPSSTVKFQEEDSLRLLLIVAGTEIFSWAAVVLQTSLQQVFPQDTSVFCCLQGLLWRSIPALDDADVALFTNHRGQSEYYVSSDHRSLSLKHASSLVTLCLS